jgi:hypothetical protein
MVLTRSLSAFGLVLLTCAEISAKGGSIQPEDPYNPQHIDGLPPEIRITVERGCRSPRAEHYFAGYFDNPKRVVLHFEYLRCDQPNSFCAPSGCMHQLWIFADGHYRLLRSYYAPAGD